MGGVCFKDAGAESVDAPTTSSPAPTAPSPAGAPAPTLGRLARYKKVRVLGEGGFGTVWLIREKETNEEWAGKFLRVTDDPRRKDMMTRDDVLNECRVLERMRHPNICGFREHFEFGMGGTVVMVLELLNGGDLLDSVINNGTYGEADARRIFRQVLDGVTHMHEAGVVHRDLKVENLMMKRADDLDSVKIIDVGMAVEIASTPGANELVKGTPEYMAPESFGAGAAARAPSVDVWGLGCMLYILLAGYSPYAHEDPAETVRLVARGEFHSFEDDPEVWSKVSDEAKDVIARCFETDPSRRVTTAGLREHPWVASANAGPRLDATRANLDKNFRRKFRSAVDTVRATVRMQARLKAMAALRSAGEGTASAEEASSSALPGDVANEEDVRVEVVGGRSASR